MTPKEKAEELLKAFIWELDWEIENRNNAHLAKQCALRAVEEIIEAIPIHNPIAVEPLLYFWQEVKQEIERL